MSDIIGLKVRARQIRNATQEGENTALRVGSLLEDIVDCLDSTGGGGDSSDSLVINSLLNTGVKIATFKKGNDITSIYAPSAGGGGGGGGGSAYDDTDLWEALNALDKALDSTTDLANDEKARLDDLVKGIGDDISGRMKDALDFAAWIQGNFPQGEVTFRSGWDTKAQQFLQTVGLWDTDAETTQTMWSNYRQSYNDIMMTVSAVTESEDFTTFLQSAITQGISEGTISINLDTVYANKYEVDDVLTWLYSGLKNQSSSDKTFNQLVSAARSGDSTGITELRTLIELQHDNKIVATTNLASKVNDAISELYQQATADTARTTIFSTVKQNSDDIAAIVVEATGDSSSSTIATKFRNWKAGLVTTANKSQSIASLLAASSDNTAAAAIAAIVNSNGSTAKISADHIQFTGQTLNAVVSGGLAIDNGKQGGGGQYSYLITANDDDGLVIDSRGGNADISIFNIDKYGNISHTYNNVTRFEFNREGDGFIACGNIAWTADGDVSIKSTGEFEDELGTEHTVDSTAHFTSNGFEIENNDDADSDFYNIFRIYRNGSILQQVNFEDVFKSNYDGTGFIGISSNDNYSKHAINWTEKTAQLFDILTVSKNVAALGADTVSIDGTLRLGDYRFRIVTISNAQYLSINTSDSVLNGLLIAADGTLGVNVNGVFKKGFDLEEFASQQSDPSAVNIGSFFGGSDSASYTIKYGLIIPK